MYGQHNNFIPYLNQLNSYLQTQQEELTKMKNEIQSLQQQINELKENPTTNIEKIEYKFDQLKIETLAGTLNIGLAPNGMTDPETLESLSVNQPNLNKLPILQQFPELYPRIYENINSYLRNNCHGIIDETAKKYGIQLDAPHRTFMMQDIERQLPQRIHYYLKDSPTMNMRNDNQEDIIDFMTEKVLMDIKNAIEVFIKHLPQGGNFSS